jgi:Flp pilus assembly pilin Flp
MTTKILGTLRQFHTEESGQGLIEYLLIIALIALGAVVGMGSVASYINSAFLRIGTRLGSYIT